MPIKHNQEYKPRRTKARFLRSAYGFTLIELLVVIAIITLLVSILLPSLSAAKELAKLTACLSNTKNLCTAGLIYAHDHQDALPPVYRGNANISQPYRLFSPDGTRTGIGLLVEGEYVQEDITNCPGTEFMDFGEGSTRRDADGNMIMGEYIWYSNGGGYYSTTLDPNDVRINATNTTEERYVNDPLVSDYFFQYALHTHYKPHGMKTNVGYVSGEAFTIDMTEFLEDALCRPPELLYPNYGVKNLYTYLREMHQ